MENGNVNGVIDARDDADVIFPEPAEANDSNPITAGPPNTSDPRGGDGGHIPALARNASDAAKVASPTAGDEEGEVGPIRSAAGEMAIRDPEAQGESSTDYHIPALGSDTMRLIDQESDSTGALQGPSSQGYAGGDEAASGDDEETGPVPARNSGRADGSLDENRDQAGQGTGGRAAVAREGLTPQGHPTPQLAPQVSMGVARGGDNSTTANDTSRGVSPAVGAADVPSVAGVSAASPDGAPSNQGGSWTDLPTTEGSGRIGDAYGTSSGQAADAGGSGAAGPRQEGQQQSAAAADISLVADVIRTADGRRNNDTMGKGPSGSDAATAKLGRGSNAGGIAADRPDAAEISGEENAAGPSPDVSQAVGGGLGAGVSDGSDGTSGDGDGGPLGALALTELRRSGSGPSERQHRETGGGGSGGGSSTRLTSSDARRSSTAGSPAASHRSSALLRRSSETTAAEQPSGDDGGIASGGGGAAENVEEQQSWRPSATAGSGGGSSDRQGSVSYAWRGSSAGGDGGVPAAARLRMSSSDDARPLPPRTITACRNASFSSEGGGSAAPRISGPYIAQGADDSSGDGLAAAMVSAAPPPPPLPSQLPPLGSQPDGAGDRSAGSSYSFPGEGRRRTSQGGMATAAPNPLPPLPAATPSGIMTLGERPLPRAVASAPAGVVRSLSGGAATSARCGRPPPPMHMMPTHVQPKAPLDECTTQAALQHVRTVWSTSNICGIRSLPNALSPDFRDRLYEELVQAAHRDRSFTAPSHKPQLSYGLEGGPLGMPLSVGQKQVARINPLAGMFTQFEYLPSEYDRVKLTGKYDRLRHKLAQAAPQEFVVRAPPSALHGAPAFCEFTYTPDPADSYPASMHADTDLARSKVVAGPFYPSGRVQQPKILKGRLDECMMRLCKQLGDDWPTSFLQMFEDRNGCVVASFQQSAAVQEGDLSAYMNTLAKRNHVVATYQLTKDATRWGLMDEGSGAVFYVLWPPWVRHRYLGPHTAPPPSELSGSGGHGMRGSNSSDEDDEEAEFATGEEAGALGQGTEMGDGGGRRDDGVGMMGYGNQPLDSFSTAGSQHRRTGVY